MKNNLVLVAIFAMAVVFILPYGLFSAAASTEVSVGQIWAAGTDSNDKKANNKDGKLNPLDTQGQFNFYYWYVPHYYGKSVDYSKMKLCVPGNPIKYPNITAFMPEESDIREQDDPQYKYNCEYFMFTDWGAMSGSTGIGTYGFDPIVEFRAPVSGVYLVEINLGGGIRLDANGEPQADNYGRVSDGIIWRILDTNKQVIFIRDYKGKVSTQNAYDDKGGTFKKEMSLKKGESIFLTPDQVDSSICDNCFWAFRVTLKKINSEPATPSAATTSVDSTKAQGSTSPSTSTSSSGSETSLTENTSAESSSGQNYASTAQTNIESTNADTSNQGGGLSTGAIAGIILAFSVLLGGGVAVYFLLQKRKNNIG